MLSRIPLADVLGLNLAQVRAFRREGKGRARGVLIESDDDVHRLARLWDRFVMDQFGAT